MKLTRQQVFAIAIEAQCDPRTVERMYEGQKKTKPLVRERVAAAVKKLKMPELPADPEFIDQIRALAPQWFKTKRKSKRKAVNPVKCKQELLNRARRGGRSL